MAAEFSFVSPMTPAHLVQVYFCHSIAQLWSDDADLSHDLAHYFRHSLLTDHAHPATVVVTYRVTISETGQWQVWCDKKLVHVAPDASYIFIYLTCDVVAKLVTRCQNHVVLHAAGLVEQKRGLILCGPSGSGKSTLAAWLIALGCDFLADDMVSIEADTQHMGGLTCPVVLKHGSDFVRQRWVGEDIDPHLAHFFNGAVWLDPELLRPDCVGTLAQPHLLVFPRYAPEATFLAQPLSTAEAIFHLMPRVLNFEHLPKRGLALVTSLARQVKAYQLNYGDVSEAAAWLRQTLRDVEK